MRVMIRPVTHIPEDAANLQSKSQAKRDLEFFFIFFFHDLSFVIFGRGERKEKKEARGK